MLAALLAVLPLAPQESKAFVDAPVITLDTFETPYRLALDFDGDGDLDVLGWDKFHDAGSSKAAHELALYENGGDGRLPKVWELLWLDTLERTAPAFVTAGDYLGDARAEFLYTWGTQVRVYQWDPGAGEAVEIGTNTSASAARDATSADFDGDGHANPAVLLADRVQIHVPTSGGVVLRDVVVPAGPWSRLLPIDVDGDGASELLLIGPGRYAWIPLGPRRHVRALGEHVVLTHEMPAVGDIDGDGDQDAVVFGMTRYQVLRNVAGRLRAEAPELGGPATGLADIDQDGDLDGVCCGGGDGGPDEVPNNVPSKFELSFNDGTGRFARAFEIEAIGSRGLAAVTDLDLDGDVELVAGRVIYYGNGPVRPPLAELDTAHHRESRAVDMDLDGDLDLAFGPVGTAENLGDGTTHAAVPSLPSLAPPFAYGQRGLPGDFDADGDCDLLVDKFSGTTHLGLYQLGNEGGEVFVERGFAFDTQEPLDGINFTEAHIQVIDIDQDGLVDVVLPDYPGRIHWNDGAAGFSAFALNEFVGGVGDMDGDGDSDLLHFAGGFVGLREGLGGRSFGPFQQIHHSVGWGMSLRDRMALGDVTGDGVLDVAWVDRNRRALVLLAGIEGTLDFVPTDLGVPYWGNFPDAFFQGNRVYAIDLDLDGTAEIVATPVGFHSWPDANTFAIVRKTGTGWSWSRQMGDPRGFLDADGDGDLDALAQRVAPNRAFEGATAGARLQFGDGLAGLGTLTPKLGAEGPFRVGETVTVRIAGGRGGASATLVRGRTRVDWNQGGLPVYVDPADPDYATTTLTLDGPSGSAGTGTSTVSFVVPASDAGTTTFY
ncbi:MAG: VCBS repeat-containing protein, partial [Planctomycetota bacterium]